MLGSETDEHVMRFDAEPRAWSDPDEDATATINYTSGTTARPKGVQITHRNIWVNAMSFGMHLRLWERDVYLHTLPMFHANGWGLPYPLAGLGATQVVLRKVDGTEILRRDRRARRHRDVRSPRGVERGARRRGRLGRGGSRAAGRVRIVCAGAPPPTRMIQRIDEELGWEFIQIYGLTETSPIVTFNRTRPADAELPAPERARKSSRAGAPALGVQVRISDVGEVLVRSNVVLDGYWDNPDATAEALVDGWFHTGDGGTLDDEGYLTISDRKKDVIITGGENVSSIEVEDCIFSHPAVAEVAVIGVPDAEVGRDGQGARRPIARRRGHRAGDHRALQGAARRIQGADLGGVPGRHPPNGNWEDPEVQAARTVLGGPRAQGELTGAGRQGDGPARLV